MKNTEIGGISNGEIVKRDLKIDWEKRYEIELKKRKEGVKRSKTVWSGDREWLKAVKWEWIRCCGQNVDSRRWIKIFSLLTNTFLEFINNIPLVSHI